MFIFCGFVKFTGVKMAKTHVKNSPEWGLFRFRLGFLGDFFERNGDVFASNLRDFVVGVVLTLFDIIGEDFGADEIRESLWWIDRDRELNVVVDTEASVFTGGLDGADDVAGEPFPLQIVG